MSEVKEKSRTESLQNITNADKKVTMCFKAYESERKIIKENAKKSQKTVAAYLREVGVNGSIYMPNYEAITQLTKEISQIKAYINLIIKSLLSTDAVRETEVLELLDLLRELNESAKKYVLLFVKEIEH